MLPKPERQPINGNKIVIYNKKANTVNAHPYMNYQWLKNKVDWIDSRL